MKIDFFRLTTMGPLHGAKGYLEEMHSALPHAAERARASVSERARLEGWDADDYQFGMRDVDDTFGESLPRVLCRSFVIYLHSIVEHNLVRVAEHVRDERHLKLAPREIAGSAIDKVRLYLWKVAELDVNRTEPWAALRDLAKVRDVLVHRAGVLGPDEYERGKLREISLRSGSLLGASYGWDDPDSELELGRDFCDHYTDRSLAFFDVLLTTIGHPTVLPQH